MTKTRKHLIERRQSLGLSQARLAEIMGVAQQQVSRLEMGSRKLHDVWVKKLAEALQLTPEEVMFGNSDHLIVRQCGVLNSAEVVEKMPENSKEPEIRPSWLSAERELQMVEVVTDSLEPRLFKGDRLFFESEGSDPNDVLNSECLAVLPDETMVVRRVERRQDGPGVLLRGYRSGTPILFPLIGTAFYRLVGIKPNQ